MIKMNLNRILGVAVLLWGVCGLQPGFAATYTWQGIGTGGTGNWSLGSNWLLDDNTAATNPPSEVDDQANVDTGVVTANVVSYSGKITIGSGGDGGKVISSGLLVQTYDNDFNLNTGSFVSTSQNLVFGNSEQSPVNVTLSGGTFQWNGGSALDPSESGSGLSLGPLPYSYSEDGKSINETTSRNPSVKDTKVVMTIQGNAEFVAGVDLVNGSLGTVFVGRGGNEAELTFKGNSVSQIGNLHIGAEGFGVDSNGVGEWGKDSAQVATGSVTVEGNATVKVHGDTYVGRYNGKATLTIKDGAEVTAGNVWIAANQSSGELYIEDATFDAEKLTSTGGAKVTVAGDRANVTVEGIHFEDGIGQENTITFAIGTQGPSALVSEGKGTDNGDVIEGSYSTGYTASAVGIWSQEKFTVLTSQKASVSDVDGNNDVRFADNNTENKLWHLGDNRPENGSSIITDYKMEARLNQALRAGDGTYGDGMIVLSRDSSVKFVNGQDLGQAGWIKFTTKEAIPYQITMIVSENGQAADPTDLEALANWLRSSGIGENEDWIITADRETSSLIFSGIAALSGDEDAIVFAWDMAQLNAAGKASLTGLNITDENGNPVFKLEGLILSNTPEPGTLGMLLLGFLWLFRRNRKKF